MGGEETALPGMGTPPVGGAGVPGAGAPVLPGVPGEAVLPGEALMAFGDRLPPGAEGAVDVRNLSPSGNLSEAAKNFFAMLRWRPPRVR